nr:phage tail sheath C-terminal domain-containing protein [Sphingomonas sp. OK281]
MLHQGHRARGTDRAARGRHAAGQHLRERHRDRFAYVQCVGEDVGAALLYRDKFSARELMGVWPEWTGGIAGTWSGKAVAIALGLRAAIDEETGWHKSLSNVPVAGVTGMSKDVHFDLQDMSTDAGLLNAGHVTTLVNMNGHRFWGNRTFSEEPQFAFEVAVRTSQAIQDEIAKALARFIDKPMTKGLVVDIVETVNASLRQWVSENRLVGGFCWYDPAANQEAALAAGRLVIDYDFTPCAPLEGLELNQRITDKYYAGFADNIAA